jgi:predicted phosphodiesterase
VTWLITSDLHLSDRARDEHRFELFQWLAKQQQKYNTTATFILGDITEKKDKHSSKLVNRIIDELIGLKPPIYILKGNHDFIDPDNPYFKFLNCIEGVEFVVEPTFLKEHGMAMIPHQPNQQALDKTASIIPDKAPGVVLHQALDGAIAETGARLSGLSAAAIETKRPLGAWAGDIHRPQRVGGITYVGAPYHVRFGDDFSPRVLIIKNGKEQNLYFPAPHKWVLQIHDADEILDNEDLREGDQVKVMIELAREEVVEWAAHKRRALEACAEMGVDVYGVDLKVAPSKRKERTKLEPGTSRTREEVFTDFCKAEKVANNIKKAGSKLLV